MPYFYNDIKVTALGLLELQLADNITIANRVFFLLSAVAKGQ